MSILKRMGNVIRSNVNDILDKAEDPKKILDQTILDMQGDHKSAKKALVETLALLKQAEKQNETFQSQASEWEQKAMIALKAGNEDLARQSLEKKQKAEESFAESSKGLADHRAQVDSLKSNLKLLESKINEAKSKRDELVARLQAADMKKKQAAIQSGDAPGSNAIQDSSAFDTFNRMVDKIENTESIVEARSELSEALGQSQDLANLDEEIKEQSADAELARLKAQLDGESGSSASSSSAPVESEKPEGDDKADAIEDELAKLRAKLDS